MGSGRGKKSRSKPPPAPMRVVDASIELGSDEAGPYLQVKRASGHVDRLWFSPDTPPDLIKHLRAKVRPSVWVTLENRRVSLRRVLDLCSRVGRRPTPTGRTAAVRAASRLSKIVESLRVLVNKARDTIDALDAAIAGSHRVLEDLPLRDDPAFAGLLAHLEEFIRGAGALAGAFAADPGRPRDDDKRDFIRRMARMCRTATRSTPQRASSTGPRRRRGGAEGFALDAFAVVIYNATFGENLAVNDYSRWRRELERSSIIR